jgi:predicted component of type VI protein secretion system
MGLGTSPSGGMLMSSVHDKLARVRKPRVHITYEVETEGAQIMRELPFVVASWAISPATRPSR